MCISNKSPGNADASGSVTSLWEPLQEWLEEIGKPIPGLGYLRIDRTGYCDLPENSGGDFIWYFRLPQKQITPSLKGLSTGLVDLPYGQLVFW